MIKEALDAIHSELTEGFEKKSSQVDMLNQQHAKGIFDSQDLAIIAEKAKELADPLYSVLLSSDNNALILERSYPLPEVQNELSQEPQSLTINNQHFKKLVRSDPIETTQSVLVDSNTSSEKTKDEYEIDDEIEIEIEIADDQLPGEKIEDIVPIVATESVDEPTGDIASQAYKRRNGEIKRAEKELEDYPLEGASPHKMSQIAPNGRIFELLPSDTVIYKLMASGHTQEQIANLKFPLFSKADGIRQVDHSYIRIADTLSSVGYSMRIVRTQEGTKYQALEKAVKIKAPDKIANTNPSVAEKLKMKPSIVKNDDSDLDHVSLTNDKGRSNAVIDLSPDSSLILQIYFSARTAPTLPYLKEVFRVRGGVNFEQSFNLLSEKMAEGWKINPTIASENYQFPGLVDLTNYKEGDTITKIDDKSLATLSYPSPQAPPRRESSKSTPTPRSLEDIKKFDGRQHPGDRRVPLSALETLTPSNSNILKMLIGSSFQNPLLTSRIPIEQIRRLRGSGLEEFGLEVVDKVAIREGKKMTVGYYLKQV